MSIENQFGSGPLKKKEERNDDDIPRVELLLVAVTVEVGG